MIVESLRFTVVNVPYRHREVSAQVMRDGVTAIVVEASTDDGFLGVGEATVGADVGSVHAALVAMKPFVLGADPWRHEAIREDLWWYGLWQFRPMTASFAWAGIDMALWDLCAKQAGMPLHSLLGGAIRDEASYFWYLGRADEEELVAQCQGGLALGFDVFYLKVGLGFARDLAMVRTAREALGPAPRLRVDANASWTVADALQRLRGLEKYDIDFVEQPVAESPIEAMAEVRRASSVALAANEGLWTQADAYARMKARVADVYCLSPYWVGSLSRFCRISHVADMEGVRVCKHTHGELGIAASACHHAILTLPAVVDGHQQTAHLMAHDIVEEPIPIADRPTWGTPTGTGIGVELDRDALREAAERFEREGQYLPYQQGFLDRRGAPGQTWAE